MSKQQQELAVALDQALLKKLKWKEEKNTLLDYAKQQIEKQHETNQKLAQQEQAHQEYQQTIANLRSQCE